MPNKSYVPTSDADKGIWLNNFTTKLSLHATVIGVTPAELTAIQKDNAMYQYIIGMIEVYRQTLSNLTGYKNMLKRSVGQQHIGALPVLPTLAAAPPIVTEGIFERIIMLVSRFKKTVGYTDNIGADLGVLPPTPAAINVDVLKPELIIKLSVGRPHIKWVKGITDAVDLYVDRDDGLGFVLLGRLLKNEYIDVAPLASPKIFDEWSYKAIYVIADTQVGLYSNVVSVDVKKI
ncbi:MAG: hypothetical protein V4565_14515 [Bacteroidota bacterium]